MKWVVYLFFLFMIIICFLGILENINTERKINDEYCISFVNDEEFYLVYTGSQNLPNKSFGPISHIGIKKGVIYYLKIGETPGWFEHRDPYENLKIIEDFKLSPIDFGKKYELDIWEIKNYYYNILK